MSPGLLETMRVRDRGIPFLDRHRARLERSAGALGMACPDPGAWATLAEFGRDGGEAIVRMEWDGQGLTCQAREVPSDSPLAVVTARHAHVAYPHKTTERAVFDRALDDARAGGADEPLLITAEGYVAEAARFAAGWIENDAIAFPDVALGVLPSIGRARVAEIAAGAGLVLRQRRVTRALLAGQSIFLVNAARGLVTVGSLDGVAVPVSPIVSDLAARFWHAGPAPGSTGRVSG